MKNVPERIFLQITCDPTDDIGFDEDDNKITFDVDFNELAGVSWCRERIFDSDLEYVLVKKSDVGADISSNLNTGGSDENKSGSD